MLEEELIIEKDSQTQNIDQGDLVYTYDPLKISLGIREDPQTVFQIVRKHTQKNLIIDPDFQRNAVWKEEQKSRFIESILMGFPIPPLYVNENEENKWVIIDGLQRTSTLVDFLSNKFALKGLITLPKFNGKKFDELEGSQKARIEDKKINIYILQSNTPLEVVYELFDRINTGGTPLNRQEVRHCIFKGKSTELLKELAKTDYFRQAIDNGVSATRMKDREIILRYLAFKIQSYETDYEGDLSPFVEKAMKKINKMADAEIEVLKKDFERVMRLTSDFFGKTNFRYPSRNSEGISISRGTINTSVFESVSVFFSKYSDDFLLKNRSKIIENFAKLLDNPTYTDAVRFSTGTKFRVANRFKLAEEILSQTE
jgi:Protein of unknown function DUF262